MTIAFIIGLAITASTIYAAYLDAVAIETKRPRRFRKWQAKWLFK